MRLTRQKEAILSVLQSTVSHPDAEWVYEQVRKALPEISLGTVYRNLKAMAQSGRVLTLETEDSALHYDADTSFHTHFVCRRCGAISDLFGPSPYEGLLEKTGYTVESEKTVFYGVCPLCQTKKDAL